MSESYREQFPLLCDDLSDEEYYSPHYKRHYRQMTYRNRARSNVKGAVTILKRWPEHWSSFLTYWWIGVIMICLMTFILYNSLLAFSVLPTAHFKPIKSKVPNLNTVKYTSQEISKFPKVYAHVFTDNKDKIDLNEYLPHIGAMANKYKTFVYHLVVVINDTSINNLEIDPEENNINALNSLWGKDIISKSDENLASTIIIEYLSLTKYMDESPVSKYWRTLPYEIIEFLIRAVSIWDKGGIAFNPIILTPQTPNTAYYKKLENVIKSFQHSEPVESLHKENQMSSNMNHHKMKQKVNNIRDIINALEQENNLDSSHDEILTEAENNPIGFVASSVHKRSIIKNNPNKTNISISEQDLKIKPLSNNEHDQEKTKAIHSLPVPSSNDSSTLSVLPSFLDYLFNHKIINNQDKEESTKKYTEHAVKYISNGKYLKTDGAIENKSNTHFITPSNIEPDKKKLSPMIVPGFKDIEINAIKDNSFNNPYVSRNGNEDQNMTIDTKGNLLATKTACHAFLGTMFTDAIHCEKKKLSDFIIKELSIFCNGVLSSCSGIDIIIL